MKTEVIPVNINSPEADRIARAADALRNGKLVAFPTETVYGLGANALDAEAVARIFEAKGRPAKNPLIVHVPDVESARALVMEWPENAAKLAAQFWPGPLTLVLPKRDSVPDIVTAGGTTVALRVPAHPVALALLKAAGIPVAAPSANRSMQLSPTAAEHVVRGLAGRIDLILDGGPTTGGIESTVLSLAGETPMLLRPGLISPAEIEAVIGPIKRIREGSSEDAGEETPLPSPGMLSRHYAPRASLEVMENGAQRVGQLLIQGETVGWLTYTRPPKNLANSPGLMIKRMPQEPTAYAAALYATLHALDDASVSRIIVDAVPHTEEWLAVRDRLQRASAAEEEKKR